MGFVIPTSANAVMSGPCFVLRATLGQGWLAKSSLLCIEAACSLPPKVAPLALPTKRGWAQVHGADNKGSTEVRETTWALFFAAVRLLGSAAVLGLDAVTNSQSAQPASRKQAACINQREQASMSDTLTRKEQSLSRSHAGAKDGGAQATRGGPLRGFASATVLQCGLESLGCCIVHFRCFHMWPPLLRFGVRVPAGHEAAKPPTYARISSLARCVLLGVLLMLRAAWSVRHLPPEFRFE